MKKNKNRVLILITLIILLILVAGFLLTNRYTGYAVNNNWCNGSDIDKNGAVGVSDLSLILSNYGHTNCSESNWCAGADTDKNGAVGVSDLSLVQGNYGNTNCGSCTPICLGKSCGYDGCEGSCGTCSSGYICNSTGQCMSNCTPSTCSQLGKQCGTWSDGCGGTLNCGYSCSSGYSCNRTTGLCFINCTESDYGLNYNLKGNATRGSYVAIDTCLNNVTLTESYCNITTFMVNLINYNCPAGCSNGACLSCTPSTCSQLGKQCGTWSDGCGGNVSCGSCNYGYTCNATGQCFDTCIDSDYGLNYYLKGNVTKGAYVGKDICWDNKTVYEAYCLSNNSINFTKYNCPGDCSNGACTNLSGMSSMSSTPITSVTEEVSSTSTGLTSASLDNTWCSGSDIDHNGAVGVSDLSLVLINYGHTNCSIISCNSSDIDHNGAVGVSDLSTILSNYGRTDCSSCIPSCVGKQCGDNGCGGTCGTCSGDASICDSNNTCVQCLSSSDCASGENCDVNGNCYCPFFYRLFGLCAEDKCATKDCNDNNLCTIDSCTQPEVGVCVHTNITCSANQYCNWSSGSCIEYPCWDSDYGLNYNIKGTVYKGNNFTSDICYSNRTLGEFYCSNNDFARTFYTCPIICSNGACKNSTG